MITVSDVDRVKSAIIRYDKRLFRTRTLARKSGLSISHIRLVIPRLKEAGFIRVYNRNSRYTLFERV